MLRRSRLKHAAASEVADYFVITEQHFEARLSYSDQHYWQLY